MELQRENDGSFLKVPFFNEHSGTKRTKNSSIAFHQG